jgi:hypothetical protein
MEKVPNLVDRAEEAIRSWFGVTTVEDAATLLDSWKHVGEMTAEERGEVLSRFEDREVPRSTDVLNDPAHEIRIKQMPGGPIEVRCSCGKWGGVAPSVKVAERDGAQHVEKQTATEGERRAWWRGYAAAWRDATSHSTSAADAHSAGYLEAVQSFTVAAVSEVDDMGDDPSDYDPDEYASDDEEAAR